MKLTFLFLTLFLVFAFDDHYIMVNEDFLKEKDEKKFKILDQIN